MTEEQIEQKAKNVYTRCFDDDFEYSGVLHALEICVEETATEATKELQEIINRIISWAEAVCPREYLHDIIIDAKKLINKDEGK